MWTPKKISTLQITPKRNYIIKDSNRSKNTIFNGTLLFRDILLNVPQSSQILTNTNLLGKKKLRNTFYYL